MSYVTDTQGRALHVWLEGGLGICMASQAALATADLLPLETQDTERVETPPPQGALHGDQVVVDHWNPAGSQGPLQPRTRFTGLAGAHRSMVMCMPLVMPTHVAVRMRLPADPQVPLQSE